MALILHLSDLHLASPDDDPDVGDYKAETVPDAHRQKRIDLITNMLDDLPAYLDGIGGVLDAIVVTGDITLRGNPAGLTMLPGLLAHLGAACPLPERTIVVPGNHDVVARTDPSSSARYAPFVNAIRSQGYVTPLLDGIDYDGDTIRDGVSSPIFEADEYVIAAINSADYSASRAPLSASSEHVLAALIDNGTIPKAVAEELEELRFSDIARVNGQQLRALRGILEKVDPTRSKVRIAALHHQLAPVSADEEFKAYETFTNLGELRMFFADNDFRIILHGHKHRARVAEDVFVPFESGADDPSEPFRSLVISCGAIDRAPGSGEVGKLLDLTTFGAHLLRLKVTGLRAPSSGGSLRIRAQDESRHLLDRDEPTDKTIVLHGHTLDDTYDLILELCETGLPSRPIICVIDEGRTAMARPTRYPASGADAKLDDEWFDRTVAWWKNTTTSDVKPFTHGQFIRRWRGATDQVRTAVESLTADVTTSRAVITLLDPPGEDDFRTHRFPAFCVVQFFIQETKLCAVAMFRKQELRYWWAINVAEIAALQDEIVNELRRKGEIVAGRITTMANLAVASQSLPQVGVPRIDQLAWSDLMELWRYALAVVDPDLPGREADIAALRRMLAELLPPAANERPADGPPLSTHGVQALAEALTSLLGRYTLAPSAQRVRDLVSQLADKSESFARRGSYTQQAYGTWQRSMERILNTLLDELTEAIPRADVPPQDPGA